MSEGKSRNAVSSHRGKMAVPPTSPAGLELDGKGKPIPLAERTKDDQEKVAGGTLPALNRDF